MSPIRSSDVADTALCVCVAAGQWVRTCGCGLLIAGINETDLHCRYRDHLRNVLEAMS